jgi:hypothetical protein
MGMEWEGLGEERRGEDGIGWERGGEEGRRGGEGREGYDGGGMLLCDRR